MIFEEAPVFIHAHLLQQPRQLWAKRIVMPGGSPGKSVNGVETKGCSFAVSQTAENHNSDRGPHRRRTSEVVLIGSGREELNRAWQMAN